MVLHQLFQRDVLKFCIGDFQWKMSVNSDFRLYFFPKRSLIDIWSWQPPFHVFSTNPFLYDSVFEMQYGTNINPLKPNDTYRGRTAPLTSKRCILYIYSTNIGTEPFKHGIYSPFFFRFKMQFFHNSNIFGSCIIHFLCTGCAKI